MQLLQDLVVRGHSLAYCAITMGELYSGLHEHEAAQAARLFSALIWVDITPTVAKRAGEIGHQWKRKGRTIALPDTMIAATALHYNLTIITDNQKDFSLPELSIL